MQNLIHSLKVKKHQSEAFLAKHFYDDPSAKLKVLGVTGTNGKTTIATMLYDLATRLGHKAGLISTVHVLINGEEYKMSRKMPTTPNSMLLNKILAEMARANCEYVFMEVTSHATDQHRVAGINFVGGVFSNLTHDHISYHKTFENYFLAKKKFFNLLPANAFALSNTDDIYGISIIADTLAQKKSYGFSGLEDFHGEISKISFGGIQLKINKREVFSKLIGKFNAYNLLAVYGAALLLGFPENEVVENLAHINPPAGRFEYFFSESGVLGVIDFAHSPDSLEKVILTAKDIISENEAATGYKGKIITVFGCGGDVDKVKRKIMGKIGASLSDVAVFTSDNPCYEDPEEVMNTMSLELSMDELEKVKRISDRGAAIIEGAKIAKKGDILLLLGKGPETYQDIKGVKHPWSDIKRLKQAFG